MRLFVFFTLIVCGTYFFLEYYADKFAKEILEEKLSKVIDRDVNIDDVNTNFLDEEIIITNLIVNNNENFNGNLIKIDKIKILINLKTVTDETVELKLVDIDGVKFNYIVLIKKGKIIDNLSLINQVLKNENDIKEKYFNEKKIYPKKKTDKNFIIRKLNIKNSYSYVTSRQLNIETKTSLGNMEFNNVGNSKDAHHFKDVLAMVLTNVISKVQNDILKQKVKQKFKSQLKNLKKDIFKDFLKKDQKDLLKKFDKLLK